MGELIFLSGKKAQTAKLVCKPGETKKPRHRLGRKCTARTVKTFCYYYYALGDGRRRSFTLEEAMPGYESRLPDPGRMAVINVFVDGMLQMPQLYEVFPGRLLFVSEQPPGDQARIIAQFIEIKSSVSNSTPHRR